MSIPKSTSNILNQLITVLDQLTVEDYTKPLSIYNGSSIGKHFRHIYDCYACLMKGKNESTIDYCNRERMEELENNPYKLIDLLERMKTEMYQIDLDKEIGVYGDFQFKNGKRPLTKSSISREMLYAYDHAVHHLAIIKLGIKAELTHVNIKDEIGVAASTLRHQLSHS